MTLHDLHIVAARDAKGAVKNLYLGDDAAKAEAIYDGAKEEMVTVGIINFANFTRLRSPQDEAERAEERKQSALSATEREQKTREIQAQNLRDQAKTILAKAEQLDPQEKPEAESKKTDEAKGKKKTDE